MHPAMILTLTYFYCLAASLNGTVRCASDWCSEGPEFDPCWVRQQSFMEIDHAIFSMVILSLPLIEVGQLSVSGKRMCTSTSYALSPLSLSRKSVVRWTDHARHDPNGLTGLWNLNWINVHLAEQCLVCLFSLISWNHQQSQYSHSASFLLLFLSKSIPLYMHMFLWRNINFSLKNKTKIFQNVVCNDFICHIKG